MTIYISLNLFHTKKCGNILRSSIFLCIWKISIFFFGWIKVYIRFLNLMLWMKKMNELSQKQGVIHSSLPVITCYSLFLTQVNHFLFFKSYLMNYFILNKINETWELCFRVLFVIVFYICFLNSILTCTKSILQ